MLNSDEISVEKTFFFIKKFSLELLLEGVAPHCPVWNGVWTQQEDSTKYTCKLHHMQLPSSPAPRHRNSVWCPRYSREKHLMTARLFLSR